MSLVPCPLYFAKWDCVKAPGLNDRKWVHIDNMDPLTSVQSRELSRGPTWQNKVDRVLALDLHAFHFDIHQMSLDEKIGQLFIASAYPSDREALSEGQPKNNRKYIQKLIKDYHIGGVLLKYYWEIEEEKRVIKEFQSLADIPLLVSQDCEWGIAMRVKEVIPLPKNMGLGAIENLDLLYAVGEEIGRQCRIMGINYALGPVADVNCNPQNPIIGMRSFGDEPLKVSMKVDSVFKGIQSQGVIACAKHFPGHGDTEKDSHHELPIITHSLKRLKRKEIYPFQQASDGGIQSIMTAHIVVKVLDEEPASLSRKVIQHYLREKIGFDGLVITDDLLMEAVDVPDVVLRAFKAGNDLILSAPDIPRGINSIKKSLAEGVITEPEIDEKLERIFRAKSWMAQERFEEEINPNIKALNSCLYDEMITVVKGPLKIEGTYRVRAAIDCEFLSSLIDISDDGQQLVVIRTAQDKVVELIDDNTIVILLGSPYELPQLPDVPTILAYDSSLFAQKSVSKVLNGALIPLGEMPIRLKAK
ncbi:MAG: Beta-hexosaminidase [Chlamydiae bacterium]|nr:Beta-hexosaminidase [Chlamydiota bacterium]